MLLQFLRHINLHKLFEPSDKVLLALSGGLDSMVMLSLFKEAGFTFGVAHCNFQLRATESDGDEALVEKACLTHNIPFHQKRFETRKFADDNKMSIQMAARELRYVYFNAILDRYNYKYAATAHHLNDSIETVFLNLIRGTGIEGLTGISVKNNTIIRPMLFATRDEIQLYANARGLEWREDSSNASHKYHRNLLRNQVIPLLKQINPGMEDSFKNTIERLKGTADLQQQSLDNFKKEGIRKSDNRIYVNKQKLLSQPYADVVLWELIKEKDFNLEQCKAIVSENHQSGKVFYGGGYMLTIDRTDFIITTYQKNVHVEIKIAEEMSEATLDGQAVHIERGDIQNFTLNKSLQIAQLDLDLIHFPLTWRKWHDGDRFMPLGMNKYKKVSDFLIDVKMPLPEKQHVTVLLSNGEIVWVIGLRIDERFKISKQTKHFLLVHHHMTDDNN